MKKFFLALLLALLALAGVLLLKAMTLSSKQLAVTPAQWDVPDSAAQRLSQAIQIPTISHEDTARIDTAAFAAFGRYLRQTFPRCESKLKHTQLGYSHLYEWTGSDPSLNPYLLMGHLDVVPVEEGTEKDWKYPAFSGTVADGEIWGRGALDDKVNVLGMLEAVEMLLAKGHQPTRTVYLAFGHDEEIGGMNGAAKVAAHLAQKQVALECVLDEGLFILEGQMPGIKQPVAFVGIAEKGFLNLELVVQSPGGHASRPPAQTAIGILSKAISRLEDSPFEASLQGPVGTMFDYLTPEMGLGLRTVFANRWLFEPLLVSQFTAKPNTSAVVRTTIAPTMLKGSPKANILPQYARAVINFRILPGETVASVKERVRSVIADARVQILDFNGFEAADPVNPSDVNTPSFKALHESIAATCPGVLIAPTLMIAATDSKHYRSLTKQIYRFSPMALNDAQVSAIHGTAEYITVANYRQMIAFYAELLGRMDKI